MGHLCWQAAEVGGDYRNWWRFTEEGGDEFKAPGESDLALDWRQVEAESQRTSKRQHRIWSGA